jgi:hypothetical protein
MKILKTYPNEWSRYVCIMQSECVKSLSPHQYLELLAESSELLLQASKEASLPDAADVREGENRKNLERKD